MAGQVFSAAGSATSLVCQVDLLYPVLPMDEVCWVSESSTVKLEPHRIVQELL